MALDATVLAALLQTCAPNVAPATMVAIIQVESQGDPYRIGINSGATLRRQPVSAVDAVATARGLLRRGANFDAGLMQINSSNFARLGLTPETLFDPCTNLSAGARVLADNYGRARNAGHGNPLQAAISEYNTGSRSRGLQNGYVGRVYAAAGQGYLAAPAKVQLAAMSAVVRSDEGGQASARSVAAILASAFDARITDTLRPMNANYGAENSYHKYGQAVDFVPRAGLHSITRDQIRAVMAANGIRLVELLGPGDPGHSDHWHVAFLSTTGEPDERPYQPTTPWAVTPGTIINAIFDPAQDGAYRVAASFAADGGDGEDAIAADPPPPAWDVFASAAWQRRQAAGRQ
jgi:hypothetical protein